MQSTVAQQIRQTHDRKSSDALRKRRDALTRLTGRRLTKAEKRELQGLISVVGPAAAPMRPQPRNRKGRASTDAAFASAEATTGRRERPNKPERGQFDASSPSVTVAELAKDLGLHIDFVRSLADRYQGSTVGGRSNTISAATAKAIRRDYPDAETADLRTRYATLRKWSSTRLTAEERRELGELKLMFAGRADSLPTRPPTAPNVTRSKGPRTEAVSRHTCKLCGQEFRSKDRSHGCAIDRRVQASRTTQDLPLIKPVTGRRRRGPSAGRAEYDISPRRGGGVIPSGHPGSGRKG